MHVKRIETIRGIRF